MTTEVKLSDDPASREWHLDKRIPVALIIGLLINAAVGVWWAASINARVDVLERTLLTSAGDRERIVRIETTLNAVDARLERMERQDERRPR